MASMQCRFGRAPAMTSSVDSRASRQPFTRVIPNQLTANVTTSLSDRSSTARRSPTFISAFKAPKEVVERAKTVDPLLIDKWDDFEEREHAMDRLVDPNVVDPDLDNPDWPESITNWWDFWNYGSWDREIIELDDAEDAEDQEARDDKVTRAAKMILAIQEISARPDVVNWLPEIRRMEDDDDLWEEPPVHPERRDILPPQTLSDVRAIAEKRRRKDTLDAEWRRRQDLIGRVQYTTPNVYNDARLQKFHDEYEKPSWQWTDEDVYKLITLNGINCRPEDHGAVVENPLLPIDYVAAGVHVIEETEEFLDNIGHYASPDMMERFKDEYELEGVLGDEDAEEEREGGDEPQQSQDEYADDYDTVDD